MNCLVRIVAATRKRSHEPQPSRCESGDSVMKIRSRSNMPGSVDGTRRAESGLQAEPTPRESRERRLTGAWHMVATCVGMVVHLCGAAGEARELIIANQQLRVGLEVPSGLLAVTDLRNDIQWRQHVPFQTARGRVTSEVPPESLIQFTDATVEGQSIRGKALWKGRPFELTFRLAPNEALLTVAIDTPDREAALPWQADRPSGFWMMTYPYAFYHNDAGSEAIVPIDEGVIYSTRDTDPLVDRNRWNMQWLQKRLSMPWWGVTDGERGVMTQVDTPYDCMFSIDWVETPQGERTLPHITWAGSKRTPAYPRRVTFRFFSEGGYVAMAKAFRRSECQRGAFRTWAEKVRANPAAERLKGALDIWHWGNLSQNLIEALQAAGIRRAIVGKPRGGQAAPLEGIAPEAVSAAVDAGYLIGGYHNDSWIQGRWIDRDPSLKDAAVLPASGELTYTKNPWDAKGRLDRCPATHASVFATKSRLAREAGMNYFFTDCTTTGGSLHECYHPKHPLRRAEGAKQLSAALQAAADSGVIVGSERGKWWATRSTHVFEGIETLIDYGGQYYGKGDATHWAGPYLKDKAGFRERFLGWDFNPARRVPLFQLVYHDSVYCTRRWNQDPGRDHDLWNRHDLMNILYGTTPVIFMHPEAGNVIGTPAWETVNDRYLQTYRNVCGWHEEIGFEEMTDHRFLSKDRLIQETRFSSGQAVVVNFGSKAWDDPRGFRVPSLAFHPLLVTTGEGDQ